MQTLQDFGEFIYNGAEIAQNDKIWAIPDGYKNVEALRKIMFVGTRAPFEFAISGNSLQEVLDRGRYHYLQWALEVLDYWECLLASYEHQQPFSGQGVELERRLTEKRFGYLSQKDARLIRDAILLECGVFLTMERRLPKNALNLERELRIKIMQPIKYWDMLGPWAGLFV